MNTRILAFTTLFTALAVDQLPAANIFDQNQRLGRGVNIIGYDPLWRSMDQARFQAKHFQLIKQAGFNNVRIDLAPFRAMDAAQNWALKQSWLDTLDWAVEHATEAGLIVILDCHEFTVMGNDPERNREKFLAFWRQLSAHCEHAPDNVFFEILNEPNKNLTPQKWNEYLGEALKIIRAKNPMRPVIVGPAFWNSVDHLTELELPQEDQNLIVTVHYYKPMEFTHQGASWTNQRDKTGIEWQGTESERNVIQSDFAKAAAWAKEHRRPLFLGEFGAYDKAPMESRARYTDCVARTAESFGWSWAYWQFDSDFLLWDMRRDAWVQPILRSLIPQPK